MIPPSVIPERRRAACDRTHALRPSMRALLSVPGEYTGWTDKVRCDAVFGNGSTRRMGRIHTEHYLRPLLRRVEERKVDPFFVITHHLPHSRTPAADAR